MSTKTISVNPDFFNLKKTKKSKKKKKFNKTVNNLQKNALKEKLINKIKKFKKKKKFSSQEPEKHTGELSNFANDYNEAFDFMEDVIKKNKKKKKRKKEKQMLQQMQKEITIDTDNINAVDNKEASKHPNIKPDPPFGILKNGKKPVYSQYMKKTLIDNNIKNNMIVVTDQNKFGQNINVNEEIKNFKDDVHDKFKKRKMNLENLKKTFFKNNNIDQNKKSNIKFNIKNKKILKRFLLGKNKKTKKISVLIKNKKTRKLVQRDERELQRKRMKEIKKFLVERSLIKAGSSAPNSLLKDLYKNCFLSGDVYNTGGKSAQENIMHNWNKDF